MSIVPKSNIALQDGYDWYPVPAINKESQDTQVFVSQIFLTWNV